MKLITTEVIERLVRKATESKRRRSNHNFHDSPDEAVQRYLIGSKLDSYFRPHCHETKWEFALVIQGAFDLLIFDDLGMIRQRIRVGRDGATMGFEIPARMWHTWVPLEEDAVFLEVKPGPYEAGNASTFAGWAPAEGDERVGEFQARMRLAKVGDRLG